MQGIPRREFMTTGAATLAGLAAFFAGRHAHAFPSRSGEEVVKWIDQLPPNPVPEVIKNQLVWEDLDSWVTPNDKFFSIAHFNRPVIDAKTWKLEIGGFVKKPDGPDARRHQGQAAAGSHIHDRMFGQHRAPVFQWRHWQRSLGWHAACPDPEGGRSLSIAASRSSSGAPTKARSKKSDDVKFKQNFARSMSLADAMDPKNILCYEMNGTSLPADNGFPLRLIAPGWYGIANAKWLKRIEVRDQRFENRFMGRDYVTLREEDHNGETVWVETSVGRALLKSAPARVTHIGNDYRIVGAAWGAPIDRVEVKIDDGPWMPATIDRTDEAEFAWKMWSLDWPKPSAGEHTVTSRAIDTSGNIQPAMNDPSIAKKHTYWESNGQVTRRIQVT